MTPNRFARLSALALVLVASVAGVRSSALADPAPAAPAADTVAQTAPASPYAGTEFDGKTHIDFTPYIWVPTLNATIRYDGSDINTSAPIDPSGGTIDTQVGPNKYLAKLNSAIMGTISIRKGNLALFNDVINTNISGSTAQVANFTGPLGHANLNVSGAAETQFVATLWTVGPSFTYYHDKNTVANVLVGGRFAWLTANANFQITGTVGPLTETYSAGASRTQSYADAVLGTYGQFGLDKHWSIPFYVDAGTGTPVFTWQALLGVKYGNFLIGWRHLGYNGAGTDTIAPSLNLGGPMLGYTIHL